MLYIFVIRLGFSLVVYIYSSYQVKNQIPYGGLEKHTFIIIRWVYIEIHIYINLYAVQIVNYIKNHKTKLN